MKSGILLVKKVAGITSHDVVDMARRALGHKEIGHAGTLDPIADGLMVLLIGQATKLSDYILTGDKAYKLRVQFGIETDTWDLEGEVTRREDVALTAEAITKAVQSLSGEFEWHVPQFSAIKISGKKLYEYARSNQAIQAPLKTMRFSKIEIIEVGPDFVECHLWCSKGSYIRTWAHELGRVLGVPSTLSQLTRTHSFPYELSGAFDLSNLHEANMIPIEKTLADWPTITVKGREETLMGHGQVPHDLSRRLIPEQRRAIESGQPIGIRVLSADSGSLVALLTAEAGRAIKIRRIFKRDLP